VAAAEKAKQEFLERAARKLGEPVDALEMKGRRIYCKANPEKGVPVAELALGMIYTFDKDCDQVVAHATVEPKDFAPPWQAGFAEVEVDTETGVVEVLRWVTAHDIGRAINPQVCEGQLEGSTGQGIGFALYEDTVLSPADGTMVSDGFDRYKIPSCADIPEHEAILVESPDPTGPFGAKSVGESGMFLQAPAIANAIYDAVGVRLRDLPMTPERVLRALKEKRA
jgi:xanthine dehydrogenase molybdenum-binding subunit